METYDIAIIGTGSGNTILDDRYAGKRAAICEQGTFGGTCLNVGCIPTKMFVYAAGVAAGIRGAARYGIDARIDGVRWDEIVSRVFGRIDPISMSGTPGSDRSSPTGATCCAPTRAKNSPPIRW
jgi:mycothione reductase